MTAGARFALTISIVLAALLGLSLCGYDRWAPMDADAQPAPDLYAGIALDAELLAADRRALKEAYQQHAIKLWGVLLSDGGRFVDNFRKGMRISRDMYHQASAQIDAREKALQDRK